jgi:hypothetical protein
MTWQKINPPANSFYHSIMSLQVQGMGMAALREMFPDAHADELNFVLFSTSGLHGSYLTIEHAEKSLKSGEVKDPDYVTYLIVHPRIVSLRYANCYPETQDDIDFLKRLRESSRKAVMAYFV